MTLILILKKFILRHRKWESLYRCSCGTYTVGRSTQVKDGTKKSCGCALLVRKIQHGHGRQSKNTKTYTSWICMKKDVYTRNMIGINTMEVVEYLYANVGSSSRTF